ncbi:hypothetical protein KUL150_30610 [Alteromonas sp. KUL150]|uniref:hypothetical protein n=1 Tax=Alteromonas sp. KUL150 TaxID=2480805 RepID=UPI0012E413CD|nr:hypothetical protein [Alteromonas sp. KUL150]GFD87002.1 hypothetical protein KUL150_30610 [Alteromonas sp. KUL150]
MNPIDLVTGILASYIANKLDVIKPNNNSDATIIPEIKADDKNDSAEKVRMFRTFDARYGIPEVISREDEPLVSILIEREPSTAYNLPCVVIESEKTREWFVMAKGNIALQGAGGGLSFAKDFVSKLQEKGAHIGIWVYDNELVDALDAGLVLWPEIKNQGIPLRSYISDRGSWESIESEAVKMLNKR